MNNIVLKSNEKISNDIIIKIGREIKSLYGKNVFPNGIAVYKHIKEALVSYHQYTFQPEMDLDADSIEKIVSVLYSLVDTDFDVEFDYEESEECEECEVEEEELTEANKHDMWVRSKTQEGWRYGLTFCENEKTDPKLRPFYQLTDKQKAK
jgi:hypothetical protein